MFDVNSLHVMLENMDYAITQLKGEECAPKHNCCNLEDFWRSLIVAASSLSTEVTKLCLIFSGSPESNLQVNDLLRRIETIYVNILKNFNNLSKDQGQVMRKKVHTALLRLVEALNAVLSSLETKGMKGQKDRMKWAACVWESCEAIELLPRNNLAATCRELDKEQMLLEDALQEFEDEIKTQEDGLEGDGGEGDNSERWSNQDCELLPPCVGLVKTARACMRRIKHVIHAQGRCSTEHEIAQLDDLMAAVVCLSPAVDEFVSSTYPPMNRDDVKMTAMEVVKAVQTILFIVKQAHFVQDQSWVNFLLKAVDHNNNKLQPLLMLT